MSLQALYMNQNWTVAQLVERIKQDRVNLNLSPGVYQLWQGDDDLQCLVNPDEHTRLNLADGQYYVSPLRVAGTHSFEIGLQF